MEAWESHDFGLLRESPTIGTKSASSVSAALYPDYFLKYGGGRYSGWAIFRYEVWSRFHGSDEARLSLRLRILPVIDATTRHY